MLLVLFSMQKECRICKFRIVGEDTVTGIVNFHKAGDSAVTHSASLDLRQPEMWLCLFSKSHS